MDGGQEPRRDDRTPPDEASSQSGGLGGTFGLTPTKSSRLERKTLIDKLRDTDFGLHAGAIRKAMRRQERIAAGLDPDVFPDQPTDAPPTIPISPRERRMSLETCLKAINLLVELEKMDKGGQIINILQAIGVTVPGQVAAMDASIVPPEQAAEIVAERLLAERAKGNGHASGNGHGGNGQPK